MTDETWPIRQLAGNFEEFQARRVLEPQIEAIDLKIGWLEVEWLKTRREKVFYAV
jgi:hypothetical protein